MTITQRVLIEELEQEAHAFDERIVKEENAQSPMDNSAWGTGRS